MKNKKHHCKCSEDFLAVQWLALHASPQGAQVVSLLRELRSCMQCGMAKQTACNHCILISPAPFFPTDIINAHPSIDP